MECECIMMKTPGCKVIYDDVISDPSPLVIPVSDPSLDVRGTGVSTAIVTCRRMALRSDAEPSVRLEQDHECGTD